MGINCDGMSLQSQLVPKNMTFWLLLQKNGHELKQASSAATAE
jgi:hypothetical protein